MRPYLTSVISAVAALVLSSCAYLDENPTVPDNTDQQVGEVRGELDMNSDQARRNPSDYCEDHFFDSDLEGYVDDEDEDGFGNENSPIVCAQLEPTQGTWAQNRLDCDDDDEDVHDDCDEDDDDHDEDCWDDDDGDNLGDPDQPVDADDDGDCPSSAADNDDDCDDHDEDIGEDCDYSGDDCYDDDDDDGLGDPDQPVDADDDGDCPSSAADNDLDCDDQDEDIGEDCDDDDDDECWDDDDNDNFGDPDQPVDADDDGDCPSSAADNDEDCDDHDEDVGDDCDDSDGEVSLEITRDSNWCSGSGDKWTVWFWNKSQDDMDNWYPHNLEDGTSSTLEGDVKLEGGDYFIINAKCDDNSYLIVDGDEHVYRLKVDGESYSVSTTEDDTPSTGTCHQRASGGTDMICRAF